MQVQKAKESSTIRKGLRAHLIVDEKKIFAAKHQLYTFAIMVATFNDELPDTTTKSEDICLVGNVNSDISSAE